MRARVHLEHLSLQCQSSRSHSVAHCLVVGWAGVDSVSTLAVCGTALFNPTGLAHHLHDGFMEIGASSI